MFQNMSRRKALSVLGLIFLLLVILYYFFVVRGFHLRDAARAVPASFPSDSEGPWQTYAWHGEVFGFPNDWHVKEVTSPQGAGNESTPVLSFALIPNNQKDPEDFIGVGGGTCKSLHATLCLGHEPVYTHSRNSDVLIIYSTIIKNIYPDVQK